MKCSKKTIFPPQTGQHPQDDSWCRRREDRCWLHHSTGEKSIFAHSNEQTRAAATGDQLYIPIDRHGLLERMRAGTRNRECYPKRSRCGDPKAASRGKPDPRLNSCACFIIAMPSQVAKTLASFWIRQRHTSHYPNPKIYVVTTAHDIEPLIMSLRGCTNFTPAGPISIAWPSHL